MRGKSKHLRYGRLAIAIVLLAFALPPRIASAQQVHLVVVTGVEAGPDDGKEIHALATKLLDASKAAQGTAGATTLWLADKPGADAARIAGRSTREEIEKALGALAPQLTPNDQLVVVLIGHGSFDGSRASFNLPGPDLTAAEWKTILDRFHGVPIAFVNTASSSGPFIDALKAPGRAIVTATRTGGERNDPRFAEYFVEAFSTDAADRDRDGRVSVQEAFEYARTKVVQVYQQEGNLLTEHATLEDGNDGRVAAAFFLAPNKADAALSAAASGDPALRQLVAERQALEAQVNALRARKGEMDPAEYDRQLETLLTDLAVKSRAIQQHQAKKPGPPPSDR